MFHDSQNDVRKLIEKVITPSTFPHRNENVICRATKNIADRLFSHTSNFVKMGSAWRCHCNVNAEKCAQHVRHEFSRWRCISIVRNFRQLRVRFSNFSTFHIKAKTVQKSIDLLMWSVGRSFVRSFVSFLVCILAHIVIRWHLFYTFVSNERHGSSSWSRKMNKLCKLQIIIMCSTVECCRIDKRFWNFAMQLF